MLNDAACFKAVYIAYGYTDLRSGMDRLVVLVEAKTGNRLSVPDIPYFFCGWRIDRIKGLVWEEDGWLLLYKRLPESRFQWPRSPEEVRSLTRQRFRWLMERLTIASKRSVKLVKLPEYMGEFCAKQRISWAALPLSGDTVFRQYKARHVRQKDSSGPERGFDGLERIGIDETSYRKGHKYMTVVINHDIGRVVWG